jgi:Fic/DOC family protein
MPPIIKLFDEWSEIEEFVRESNRIEGILRSPNSTEVDSLVAFLRLKELHLMDVAILVSAFQPGAVIRDRIGLDVRIGAHIPPRGGPYIGTELSALLSDAAINRRHAYLIHHDYETLHPFMDGNGRSGRALWLWQMIRFGNHQRVLARGFLHSWYYQSLQFRRKDVGIA